jgi:iturin family lipopeptide synthetase A
MSYKNNDIRQKTISELFEIQVEKTPKKTAITCGEEHISYKELNQKSNQLARILKKEGVKPDCIVGIMAERSIKFVIAILGIFKAGGAFLPIDPDYPLERVKYIVNDSDLCFILVNGSVSSDNVGTKTKIIDIDCIEGYCEDDFDLVNVNNMKDLAYVIYTSGSTGSPKGAMIEHSGMLNHIQAKITDLKMDSDSILAQNASQCFDISVWQTLTPLILGGKIVIIEEKVILNPSMFINKLVEENITILEVVPSYLNAIINNYNFNQNRFDKLKYLVVTGETLKSTLVSKWYKRFPDIPILNAYGPTEASDDITHYFVQRDFDMERIPIGKPIQNLQIYIVNDNRELCNIGEKGEIWVSGIGVGRGYINNLDKTKEVFINDYFSPRENIRLYKTGDIGAWLPDGNIDFFGRKDNQVKVNGYRIELGEIENELVKHQLIEEAITIIFKGRNDSAYLCSYIVVNGEISESEIRSFLSRSLPDYMIPLVIIKLDMIPLLDNGKIDRKALPNPLSFHEIDNFFVTDDKKKGDIIEQKIRDLLYDALEINKQEVIINDEENLSKYGFNSISYIKLIVNIELEFEIEFDDEDLEFSKFINLKSIINYVRSKM